MPARPPRPAPSTGAGPLRVLLLATLLLTAWPQAGIPAPVADSAVKLAIVYNIGKFVDWPADNLPPAGEPFVLCVFGHVDGLRPGLGEIEGKPLHGRSLSVRTVSAGPDIHGCQILYLSEPEPAQLPLLLDAAQAQSVLTVSDMEHFADQGGDVALTTQDNRVRFEINLSSAQSAHLTVSSDLLRLATRVISGGKP